MSTPVWKGHLTLGELAIAARLFTGPRAESFSLSTLHSCGGHVGQRQYCKKGCISAFTEENLRKGYEYAKARYIELPAEQLAEVTPKKRDTLAVTYTGGHVVDPIFFEAGYYLWPEAESEPEYIGLYRVLKESDRVLIGKIVLQRERFMIIRPFEGSLVAHTLFYAGEAKLLNAFRPDLGKAPKNVTDLAQAAKFGSFDPKGTVDHATDRLKTLVEGLAKEAIERDQKALKRAQAASNSAPKPEPKGKTRSKKAA